MKNGETVFSTTERYPLKRANSCFFFLIFVEMPLPDAHARQVMAFPQKLKKKQLLALFRG